MSFSRVSQFLQIPHSYSLYIHLNAPEICIYIYSGFEFLKASKKKSVNPNLRALLTGTLKMQSILNTKLSETSLMSATTSETHVAKENE